MGKLHKLRKKIEANPRRWIYKYSGTGRWRAWSAKIEPGWRGDEPYSPRYGHGSYRAFVRHVLRELGYQVE